MRTVVLCVLAATHVAVVAGAAAPGFRATCKGRALKAGAVVSALLAGDVDERDNRDLAATGSTTALGRHTGFARHRANPQAPRGARSAPRPLARRTEPRQVDALTSAFG